MKTKFLCPTASACRLLAGLVMVLAAPLGAAPLAGTTAVHAQPDAASPAISFLKAGQEPVPAANAPASTPPGWMAIELPGPFEGYIENKDLTKSLDVKPGVAIKVAPKPDGGVLATAEKGDKTTITGLRGKWTQISLEKPLLGYIKVEAAGNVAPVASTGNPPPPGGAMPAAPVSPGVYGSTAVGQAAPSVNLGEGGSGNLARQFAGRIVSTRRALTPRRPYDYALNDDAGKRYAYLDISKLLLTEQIEKYIEHHVVVFGAARPVPDTKDMVIQVETLQLK